MSNEQQQPQPPKVITHVTTKPNKKPPTQLDNFKKHLHRNDYVKQVANYFGGREDEALRFMTSAVEYVRRVPKLLECEPQTLLTALVTVAQFRFMPSGVSGEAYIIPYGSEVKFQLGYQGIVTLLYRTDKVKSITANIVYENDLFDYEEGAHPKLVHKPAPFGNPKGKPIAVYTVAQLDGNVMTFKIMSEADVMEIKNLSKAKNTSESPWNSDKDPFLWMWKKTCLIQHGKLLPKTEELQKAIEADFGGEGMRKPHLDAGGAAVGVALHRPEDNGMAGPEIPESEQRKSTKQFAHGDEPGFVPQKELPVINVDEQEEVTGEEKPTK